MKKPVLYSGIALFFVLLLSHLYNMHTRANHSPNVIGIETATVIQQATPLLTKSPGTVEASQSVAIQSQVTGTITKIAFTPGQTVSAGQLLFAIDPSIYQANLAKAEANLAKDNAQLIASQKDIKRYQVLIKEGYVSKEQYDQINATLGTEQGAVAADQADIRQTQEQLNNTHIVSPIAGKTGNVTLKEGDLVTAENGQTLVTINQLNPVFVDFYLPEEQLATLMRYQQVSPLTVNVFAEDGQQILDTGKLTFIDNTVNSTTDSILLKGSMPNTQHLLWPGESVRVKLIFAVDKNALAIPAEAVQTDQQGNFVYVIKNHKAVITRVTILRQASSMSLVSAGLKVGDVVATVFPPNITNNAEVNILSTSSPKVAA